MPEQRTLWSRLKDFLGFGRKEDEKPARTQGQKAPDPTRSLPSFFSWARRRAILLRIPSIRQGRDDRTS